MPSLTDRSANGIVNFHNDTSVGSLCVGMSIILLRHVVHHSEKTTNMKNMKYMQQICYSPVKANSAGYLVISFTWLSIHNFLTIANPS